MDNQNVSQQNLVSPNTYIANNSELGRAIINGYIDENNALRQMWGYEAVEFVNGEFNGKILAQLVTSKQYLVCCDIEGVYILQNINNKFSDNKKFKFLKFSNGSYYRKFKDIRIKDATTGKDKYSNGYKYFPNKEGFNMVQGSALQTSDNQSFGGFVYVTDGSIGGLYILVILDNFIELFQLDYAQIKQGSQATVIPYVDGKVIHCVSPVSVELFNQRILIIDERWNYNKTNTRDITSSYFYALSGIGLDIKDKKLVYDLCNISEQFKMAKPIVKIISLNNLAYVLSQDRTEFYVSASANGSLTGIQKVLSNAVEIGVEYRNLIYVFNGKLIFIGSSVDKRNALYVWIGGQAEPMEFTNNNLSYLFNQKSFDPTKISITAFSTPSQEFAIINGLGEGTFGNCSVMVEITEGKQSFEQKSTFLIETNKEAKERFKSDEIFRLNNEYYFVSYEDKKIFFLSQFLSDFNGDPIELQVRTSEFTPLSLNGKLDISLDSLILQKMPEDALHPYKAIEYMPHLVDKNSVCFEVFYKSPKNNRWYKIGKEQDYYPINNNTMRYDSRLSLMTNVPRGQIWFKFYPKIYEVKGQFYASIVVINFLNLNVELK